MFFKIVLVFILVALVNFLWANYISHVSRTNSLMAALYGTAISLFGNVATVIYISDNRMIIPAAIATFIGTYFSVKRTGNKSI